MSPTREFMLKITMGLVVFAVVCEASLLIAKLVLVFAPSNNGLAVSVAAPFFILGSFLILAWMNRQARDWWDRF